MNMVSIIIPIYNAQKYIKACLESILNQTYQDFEVILVDDGSRDASGEICDHYAEKDRRITVFHRENAGVSATRNFGLDYATGKYVLFIDADDTIEADMLEGCIRLAEKNEAELVICSFRYYMTDDDNRIVENSLGNDACVTDKELFDHWFSLLAEKEILNPPWNKLIRKDLLDTNKIRFYEEFSICEDMTFSVQILDASKKIVLTGNMYYNYYLKSSGTLVFKFHENYYEALTKFYGCVDKYCSKFTDNNTQLKLIKTMYVNLIIMFVKQICIKSPWDKKTKYKKMKEIGRSYKFLHAIKGVRLSQKRKLICYLLKYQQANFISIIYYLAGLKVRIAKKCRNIIKKIKSKSTLIDTLYD